MRIFEIGDYLSWHGKQNRGYHVKGHKNCKDRGVMPLHSVWGHLLKKKPMHWFFYVWILSVSTKEKRGLKRKFKQNIFYEIRLHSIHSRQGTFSDSNCPQAPCHLFLFFLQRQCLSQHFHSGGHYLVHFTSWVVYRDEWSLAQWSMMSITPTNILCASLETEGCGKLPSADGLAMASEPGIGHCLQIFLVHQYQDWSTWFRVV